MPSIIISLPDLLQQFVDGQIIDGRYSSASDYILELIQEDERRKAEQQLEALLLEGLDGEETEMTAEDWQSIRTEAAAKLKARQS